MREPRNPFRLRASEHIESNETFVRLFSPDVLDMLCVDDLWDRHQIIRSAPGGGKTSLFRIFTPRSLLTIFALRARDHAKDLFRRLKDIGAVGDDGPLVLGLFLSCSQSYAMLDDLSIDVTRKQRLLLSLLNARITLSALQGALLLKGLSYPDDLEAIDIRPRDKETLLFGPELPQNGKDLYEWAKILEKTVCDALDSFVPLSDSSLPGHDSLHALHFITAETLHYNGLPVADRILLMLDDVHRLTATQRRFLLNEVIATRFPNTVWIAERLEALEFEELLSSGASNGRDYGQVITIEDYWRGSASKRFVRVVSDVADRRARDARDVEIGSFTECLQDSLDGTEWQSQFVEGTKVVSRRVSDKAYGKARYIEWVRERENISGTAREVAIAWRTLEILIERDQQNVQRSFDFALGVEDLEHRDVSSVRAAAELFFCQEFNIPYYFGFPRLASMASSNIEQFLWLTGGLFEESVSAILLKKLGHLDPISQERILKKTIKQRWKSIPQQIKHGADVSRFLEAVGKFSKWETEKPNAPYAPGVTGIAISMMDREMLNDRKATGNDPDLLRLSQILTASIAHNLVEVTLNQKCKGQNWMVLYLNRMLCVHFGLPMQYGGWREKQLHELVSWLNRGFTPPSNRSGIFS